MAGRGLRPQLQKKKPGSKVWIAMPRLLVSLVLAGILTAPLRGAEKPDLAAIGKTYGIEIVTSDPAFPVQDAERRDRWRGGREGRCRFLCDDLRARVVALPAGTGEEDAAEKGRVLQGPGVREATPNGGARLRSRCALSRCRSRPPRRQIRPQSHPSRVLSHHRPARRRQALRG